MIRKVLSIALWSPVIVFLSWLSLSFVDIAIDNTTQNPEHSNYNIFVVCEEWSAE